MTFDSNSFERRKQIAMTFDDFTELYADSFDFQTAEDYLKSDYFVLWLRGFISPGQVYKMVKETFRLKNDPSVLFDVSCMTIDEIAQYYFISKEELEEVVNNYDLYKENLPENILLVAYLIFQRAGLFGDGTMVVI